MKYDEFAFFNQQLAAMLRDGIPLEGALRQLCANMQHGQLRSELLLLEADLKNGLPLKSALAARRLPPMYVQMISIGLAGNDLPGVLLMLADYYRSVDSIWARLKGLMVYPALVLTLAFALSAFITFGFERLLDSNFASTMGVTITPSFVIAVWVPPILIGLMLTLLVLALVVPAMKRWLRWRLPAFKEAKLAQLASAMSLMLKGGGNLDDALGVIQQLESRTPASRELARWKDRLGGGRGTFADMAGNSRTFPPMFLWLVGNAGEDLAGGFQRAADIYAARAVHRIDLFLFTAVPLSILALGSMIVCQTVPMVQTLTGWMNAIN